MSEKETDNYTLLYFGEICLGFIVLRILYAVITTVCSNQRNTRWHKKKSDEESANDSMVPLINSERNDIEMILPYFSPAQLNFSRQLRMQDISWSPLLTLFLNGSKITLSNPDPACLLVSFIRDSIGLKGTKQGCEEGGCGACTVVLENDNGTHSVNSCLRPLCANDGMSIITVEGIGSIRNGLSVEQEKLVKCNGTQCGYCTPGWIANMHALNLSSEQEGRTLTPQQIENYLDGNLCRCTGYKPILKAFQSFGERGQVPKGCTGSCETCTACDDSKHGSVCDLEDMCCTAKNVPSACRKEGVTRVNAKMSLATRAKRTDYVAEPLLFFNKDSGKTWIRPVTMQQLTAVLRHYGNNAGSPLQLLGGNTSIGVTKYYNDSAPYNSPDQYSVFVDVNSIPEFASHRYDLPSKKLTVGAAVTLTELIELLRNEPSQTVRREAHALSSEVDHSSVFSVTASHLEKVANTQVRNAATWAGNLMVFLRHTEFPSDALLAFTTAEAVLTLSNLQDELSSMSFNAFLEMGYDDFKAKGYIIVSITICDSGSLTNGDGTTLVTETFKVAQRSKNSHAYVNAGFQYHLSNAGGSSPSLSPPYLTKARVVFGGVSRKTFIAKRTEAVLSGAHLGQAQLNRALIALQMDLQEAGIAYGQEIKNNSGGYYLRQQRFRETVMRNCLYRSLLRCYPLGEIPENIRSALLPWVKGISKGTEVFLPEEGTAPVSMPVRKLEGPAQATGEAVYPSDEPLPSGTGASSSGFSGSTIGSIQSAQQGLHAAMVFTTRCASTFTSFDANPALSIPGVVAFYSAKDIPGENTGGSDLQLFLPIGSESLCIGFPVGVVVATSEALANTAAAAVKTFYADIPGKSPIVSIDQAIASASFYDLPDNIPELTIIRTGEPEKAMESSDYRVKGHVSAGGQSHFYMETQSAIARPQDGEYIEVICGTQMPTAYQASIAAVLGVKQTKVTVQCARVGGAFGGKITRGTATAAAAALACSKLGRPVKIFNSRTADMAMTGGRESFSFDYEVGFSADGMINAVSYGIYCDAGMAKADALGSLYMGQCWADNSYYLPNYVARAKVCRTNVPAKTSMRAPGVVQTCLATEIVVERVSRELGLPTQEVQHKNFIRDGLTTILGQPITDCTLETVWSTLLERSRYSERLEMCQRANSTQLWRKRGISICPVKYGMGWAGYNAGIRIGVNKADGSVVVSHSGCELGQGINTKVAQTVAYELGVPLELVRIMATSSAAVSNGGCTGGSGTSEVVCQAAINACATLKSRIGWTAGCSRGLRLASHCNSNREVTSEEWTDFLAGLPYDVSCNVEGWFSPNENPNGYPFQYFVYAAAVTEVELDVLTGLVHVLASEIVYDCGQSLNPAIDIGQIEGGLVMGLGYFLTESVDFDNSGNLISSGTWEYKIPMVDDIPGVLNVTLLKNTPNGQGILSSKAVGEPPYVVANSVYFAVKMAIDSAREDSCSTKVVMSESIPVPSTVDVRQLACNITPDRLIMPNL